MIYGIGSDIVYINRFSSWIENEKKIKRFFTEKEFLEIKKSDDISKIASKWALKEAFSKSIGISLFGLDLKQIECLSTTYGISSGKPYIVLYKNVEQAAKKISKNFSIHCSASHDVKYCLANVIFEIPNYIP